MDSTERPSGAVIAAVAEATGSSVIGPVGDDLESAADVLDPLYDAIDPDALDALFRPTARGERRVSGRLEFDYAGCEVLVLGRGLVKVRPGRDVGPSFSTTDR